MKRSTWFQPSSLAKLQRLPARPLAVASAGLVALLAICGSAVAENWPQFRGPHGTFATTGRDLPTEFGNDKNLIWKFELPGHSAATPAIWGEHIFVCTPEGEKVFLVDLDLSGKERWRRELGSGNRKLGFNGKNNYATSSPVTDGEHVWQLIGTGTLACFDFQGEEVWKVDLNELIAPYKTGFGIGFTPLLYKEALYLPFLHQGESSVVALDKKTGAIKWKTPRTTIAEEESKDAYSSACVMEYPDHAEIVVCGADLANAYDSETGREIWSHGDINPKRNKTLRIVVSPITDRERIYVSSAKRGPVYAIRSGGQGDVTSSHRQWICEKDTPDVPTPAIDNGLVYLLRENGVMSVLDAATGEPRYSERFATGTGAFSASPVVADGKVFLASEGGLVVVLAAGPKFEKLGESELGEMIMATPVVIDNRVYIRTEKALYCFGKS